MELRDTHATIGKMPLLLVKVSSVNFRPCLHFTLMYFLL